MNASQDEKVSIAASYHILHNPRQSVIIHGGSSAFNAQLFLLLSLSFLTSQVGAS